MLRRNLGPILWTSALVTVLGLAAAPARADDMFLQLGDIQGESTARGYERWIDVVSWSWGVTNPTTVGAGTGLSAGRATLSDLTLMKTTRSAFEGFPRDRFTTLKETADRIMATKVAATWAYDPGVFDLERPIDFDVLAATIRATLLDVFADHHSVSVQASIWIIGKAILERHPDVSEVSMSLPNLHHWTVDLSPFGIENDREVYISTTEPHGLIEATIRRGG